MIADSERRRSRITHHASRTGDSALSTQHSALVEHLLVLLLFTVLSIAMTWPAVLYFGEAINSFGDTVVQMTTLAWNGHALATNPLGLFEAPFFYPYQHSNAYSEHLLGQTILGLPFLWSSGNPAPAANLNSLLSFVLTGWGTYLLVRDLTGSRWAALAAAIAFTFNGFRYMQSGHLHMLSTEWFPLTLWALRRGLAWNSGRYIALAAFFFICMALFSVYYLFFLALVVALYLGWWLAFGRRSSVVGRRETKNSHRRHGDTEGAGRREPGGGNRDSAELKSHTVDASQSSSSLQVEPNGVDHASRITHQSPPGSRLPAPDDRRPTTDNRLPLWLKLTLAAIAIALCLAPIYYPYFQVNQELGFSRSVYEVQNWAARWQHYVNVLPSQWLWANLFPGMVSNAGERQLFPGLIISLLALIGLAGGLWRVIGRRLPVAARRTTTAGGRSASPSTFNLQPSTRDSALAFYFFLGLVALVLTFGISYRLPIIDREVPLPYALLYDWVPGFTALRVPVRFAVLVDLSLAVLGGFGLAWLLRRVRPAQAAMLALPLLGLMLLEYVQVRDLSNHRDVRPARHELSEWLAANPGPLIELPMTGGSEDVWYTYWATYHWQPLVNGFSSFVPPGTIYTAQAMRSFPDPAGIALLQGLEVRHVIVHLWQFPADQQGELRRRLEGTPELRLAHQVGEDYVYVLAPGDWLANAIADLGTNGVLWIDAGTTQSSPALETIAYALRYDRLERARLAHPSTQLAGDAPLGYRSLPALASGQVPDLFLRPAAGAADSPLLRGWEQLEATALVEIYRRDPALLARYDLTAPPDVAAPFGLRMAGETRLRIGANGIGFADDGSVAAASTGLAFGAGILAGSFPAPKATAQETETKVLRLLIGAYSAAQITLTANGTTYPVSLKPGLSLHSLGNLKPGDQVTITAAAAGQPAILLADLLAGHSDQAYEALEYANTILLEVSSPTTSGETVASQVRVVPRAAGERQFTLTLDIYQKPYGAHPDGHYGSWSLPLPAGEDGRVYELSLDPAAKQVTATLNGGPAEVFSWIGPPRAGDFAASLVLTEGERLVQSMPLYDFSVRDGRLTEVDIRQTGTLYLPVGE